MTKQLPIKAIEACEQFARKVQYHYSRIPNNLNLSIRELACAKMAEVAVAHALGLKAASAIEWNVKQADGDIDMVVGDITIDVKNSTHPRAKNLLWPGNKYEQFEARCADVLVFTRTPEYGKVEVVGWCWKNYFRSNATVHDGMGIMTTNTMSLSDNLLEDIQKLRFICDDRCLNP